jgi:DNA-binding NarL/FixJ family response regulator
VCGEAVDGRDAVRKAKQLTPDIAIVDISMPMLNGIETTRQLRAVSPRTEVIVLSMHDSEELVRDALLSGARAYVLKAAAGRDLIAAVSALREGKPFFSAGVNEILLDRYLDKTSPASPGPGSRLTRREREIVQLLAEGRTNKEVASMLDISIKTALTHRNNILHKLGLHSLAGLVRYAIRNKIVEA